MSRNEAEETASVVVFLSQVLFYILTASVV